MNTGSNNGRDAEQGSVASKRLPAESFPGRHEALMAASDAPSGIDLSHYALETIHVDGVFAPGVPRPRQRQATSLASRLHSRIMSTEETSMPSICRCSSTSTPLRNKLDPTWAVRPLAVVQHQGRTCLCSRIPRRLLATNLCDDSRWRWGGACGSVSGISAARLVPSTVVARFIHKVPRPPT